MTAFQEALDHCAFQAYERQNRLATLVGDRDWLLDSEAAVIKFGEDLVFPVQFLGTESELTNTWLWADANTQIAVPAKSLELCRKVRVAGQKVGIDEFGVDHFPLVDEVGKPSAHTLAMVAIVLSGASAYYRGPHESGAVFVAINDPRIDAQPDLDREGFVAAFNNLIWQPGDTKKRIVSYLAEKGCIRSDWDGTELRCNLPAGEEIGLSFRQGPNGSTSIKFRTTRG